MGAIDDYSHTLTSIVANTKRACDAIQLLGSPEVVCKQISLMIFCLFNRFYVHYLAHPRALSRSQVIKSDSSFSLSVVPPTH